MSDHIEDLMSAARQARESAYAPYSGYKVGAAIRLQDGTVVTGANVENVSYGLSICAERAAAFQSARERCEPDKRPVAIAIAATPGEPAYPCGACRQVLFEFADELDVAVEVTDAATGDIRIKRLLLSELLPSPFKKD